MLFYPRSTLSFIGVIFLLGSLSACADSPFGRSVEDSLAADPQLQEQEQSASEATPTPAATPEATPTPDSEVALPEDFPTVIPQYEGAILEDVTDRDGTVTTQWTSDDPINAIETFYQGQFEQNDWQLLSPTEGDGSAEPTDDRAIVLEARRDDVRVKVSIAPNAAGDGEGGDEAATAFEIAYTLTDDRTAATPDSTPDSTPDNTSTPAPSPTATATNSPTAFSDLDGVPQARSYIEDLAALGVLTSADGSDKFDPDRAVTRREYARWLLDTNNKLYSDAPTKQIRPATASTQPVFGDIPATDPDFGTIQGLADAGIVPSRLTGATTIAQFRPDAALTREELVSWKVPLDLRRGLSATTPKAIGETWGFQDASRIDAKALPAVQADFQNGDLSNIRRAFGYTTLFQPKKTVTRAEAASTLWYFGFQGEGRSAALALQENSDGNGE